MLEVVQGKADDFIYDQMSAYQNRKRNQGSARALLNPFQQEKWGKALRKGDDPLKVAKLIGRLPAADERFSSQRIENNQCSPGR